MSKARLVITAVTVEKRPVSEVAKSYGVARSWVYTLLARYEAEGKAAFEPRSRRPKASPRATSPDTVELIVTLRKELAGQGLDAGPQTIIWHQGGILFLNPATGKQIEVSNFVISVHRGVLTAEANGNPKVRVPLFQLSLDPRHDPRGTALRADQRDRRHPHRNRSQRPGHHLRHHPVHAGPGNRHRQHAPAVLIRRRPSRRQQHQPWHPVW
jgi:leucine-zipper of insertion element IS481